MAERLAATGPVDGLGLPLAVGACRLSAAAPGPMLSVAPFRSRQAAVSDLLQERLGAGLPDQGRFAETEAARIAWLALGQWLVMAETPDGLAGLAEALAELAAVSDQSDAWAVLDLAGDDAPEVLARLMPLDPAAMAAGAAARTEFAHMMALVLRRPECWRILVMRSFAGTAVRETGHAMRAVAARAAIGS